MIKPLVQKKIVLFWTLFWLLQSLLMSGGAYIHFYLLKNIAIVGLQALVVYINWNLLFPLLFTKGKYVLYIFSSIAIIYLIFSCSFYFIDIALSFTGIPINFSGITFSTDFWRILSGSSFYSLALVCSTIYKLWKINKANDEATSQLLEQKKQLLDGEQITIIEGKKTHLVAPLDVLYIKGLKEYVIWHTKTEKIIVLESLANIETKYRALGFIRIHKSYIVNINNISSIMSSTVKINNETIPIGRTYKKAVKQLLFN